MIKRFLSVLLLIPFLVCCNPETPVDNPDDPIDNPSGPDDPKPEDDLYAKAAPEIYDGETILATNRNVEKFLTFVDYPDKDWSYTEVLNYYGGFNNVKYDEEGNPDPNGEVVKKPVSDKPESYSIRWTPDVDAGALTLTLADDRGWSQNIDVAAGKAYVDITNLVPNSKYTWKVTANEGGKVFTQGSFSTTGHLHQVFFTTACRNGRDLGGWKTLDGKTVKYRKIYRGGRMEEIAKKGGVEAIAQGIGAELDLRNSDRLSKPAVSGLDFCAPGIEQGGIYMLTNSNENGNYTKQCFEFIVNSLRQDKGVYFHCSLGRDRTGTLGVLLLGLLGVREGDISKEYEVTYFAPLGYSVSSSELPENPDCIFRNTRDKWVYSEVAPYFWGMAGTEGTFAQGVEKYLLTVAGVSQKDIDDFRSMMLE
ncbi:MAG: tyrosine-protein phosphatase [Bacteroidales bacterium]|nr:tyrosine-protein phosphatase [Bacteroidales bacterium]